MIDYILTAKNIRKGVSLFYPFLLFILLTGITSSCRKDENLGREIQPNEGNIFLVVTDSFKLQAATIQAGPERTDERFISMLGVYEDPVFGRNSVSFISQLNLSSNGVDFGDPDTLVFDSMVLSLDIIGIYRKKGIDAEVKELLNVKVYELAQDLALEDTYNSSSDVKTKPGVIGEFRGPVNLVKKPIINGKEESSQIRIRMDDEWGKKLLFAGVDVYENDASFQAYLKGIKVVPEYISQTSDGAIFSFDPISTITRMTAYYHNISNDTVISSFNYPINSKSAYFGKMDHDYTNTEVGAVFNDTLAANETMYLQSLMGVNVVIELSDLIEVLGQGDKVINLAELYVPADSTQEYAVIRQLTMKRLLENGTTELLPDQLDVAPRDLDGFYNFDKKYYRFRITQYIEERLRLYDPNDPQREVLILTPFGNNITANRSVIHGLNPADPNKEPVKLIVSYTPL